METRDDWMSAEGEEWRLQSLEGEVIGVYPSYEKARDAGLEYFPVGEDFAVIKEIG